MKTVERGQIFLLACWQLGKKGQHNLLDNFNFFDDVDKTRLPNIRLNIIKYTQKYITFVTGSP